MPPPALFGRKRSTQLLPPSVLTATPDGIGVLASILSGMNTSRLAHTLNSNREFERARAVFYPLQLE